MKDDSFYIIQGETKASKTKSGTPLIEVVCFDISIKDTESKNVIKNNADKVDDNKDIDNFTPEPVKNNEVAPSIEEKKEYKPIKWYSPDEIIYIPSKDVFLTVSLHLNTRHVKFGELLKKVSAKGDMDVPIAVKPLDNGKYTLVMGIKQYTVAKMLNFEMIPAVIRTQSHDELVTGLGIDRRPW